MIMSWMTSSFTYLSLPNLPFSYKRKKKRKEIHNGGTKEKEKKCIMWVQYVISAYVRCERICMCVVYIHE